MVTLPFRVLLPTRSSVGVVHPVSADLRVAGALDSDGVVPCCSSVPQGWGRESLLLLLGGTLTRDGRPRALSYLRLKRESGPDLSSLSLQFLTPGPPTGPVSLNEDLPGSTQVRLSPVPTRGPRGLGPPITLPVETRLLDVLRRGRPTVVTQPRCHS